MPDTFPLRFFLCEYFLDFMVLFGFGRIWDNTLYPGWKVLPQRRVFNLKEKKYEEGEMEWGREGIVLSFREGDNSFGDPLCLGLYMVDTI